MPIKILIVPIVAAVSIHLSYLYQKSPPPKHHCSSVTITKLGKAYWGNGCSFTRQLDYDYLRRARYAVEGSEKEKRLKPYDQAFDVGQVFTSKEVRELHETWADNIKDRIARLGSDE